MPSENFHHRNRRITACLECRRRRRKCDRLEPCSNCRSTGRSCVFLSKVAKDQVSDRLKTYKLKLAESDKLLGAQQEHARDNSAAVCSLRDGLSQPIVRCQWLGIIGNEELPPADWEHGSGPQPVATAVLTLKESWVDSKHLDDLYVGRMSLATRIAGFFRPDLLSEVQALATCNSILGILESPGSPEVWTPESLPGDCLGDVSDLFSVGMTEENKGSLLDLFPVKTHMNELMRHFRISVHPIACTVRWSRLVARYDAFWEYQDQNVKAPPALEALISSIMFAAAISLSRSDSCRTNQRDSYRKLVHALQGVTERALIQARYLHTSDMETLQALVVYLGSQFRGQLTMSHCSILRSAIQIAESMGLHRDGSFYGYSAEEIVDRRLLWLQMCVLDMRVCESYGPRPGIRLEDFDVLISLKAEPDDTFSNVSTVPDHCSSTIFNTIRFECNQMRRLVWNEMCKLETGKISLSSVLKKVDNFHRAMSAKYNKVLLGNGTFKSYTRKFYEFLIENIYVMILFPYYTSSLEDGHTDLRDRVLSHIMQSLEAALELETGPQYSAWAWNLSSYHQYYATYALLVESLVHPMRPDMDRLWRILDFVFDCNPLLSNEDKSIAILKSLMVKIPKLHLRLGISPTRFTPMESTPSASVAGFLEGESESSASPSTTILGSGYATYFTDESLDIDWEEFDRLF